VDTILRYSFAAGARADSLRSLAAERGVVGMHWLLWSDWMTDFAAVLGPMTDIEVIAAGVGVRDRTRLRRLYGAGRWRKMKGVARIRLHNGDERMAELHWYEAHGIGKREIKRKAYVD
jgi:hypothetical protein